jgi:hypothetical protein
MTLKELVHVENYIQWHTNPLLNLISKQNSVSIRKQNEKQNDNRITTLNIDEYENSAGRETLHEIN